MTVARRPARATLAIAALLVATAGAACTRTAVELPDTEPSISGVITSVDQQGEHRGILRIEADPDPAAASDKAVVTVRPQTQLVDDAGQKVGFAQFKVGRKVRAWFTGPVRESYPVQADAATVLLEPPGK